MATYQINQADTHVDTTHHHSDHDHAHDFRQTGKRSLYVVLMLLGFHMVVEVIGGILSGSLGLLAHATHMMTDVVAIGLALFAMWVAERPATVSRTFGYHRVEVLVVMVNAVALTVLASWILYEAYHGFHDHAEGHSHDVQGWIMLSVACLGLAINATSAWILYRSSRHSLNVEGAFWHIMADMMGSVAVLVSGIILLVFDWDVVDYVLSIALAGLILFSAGRLALKVFRILLESVPEGLDMYRLCSRIEDVDGVTLVHDVHAWTVTSGYNALAAHILVDPEYPGDVEVVMREVRRLVEDEFGIHHATLQMERSAGECSESHHVDHLHARALTELD